MITKDYIKASNLIHITLDQIYNDLPSVTNLIDKNLINIVNTEAPLTLNTLKARFREIFDVAKISGKALDIIMDRVNALGIIYEEELYDFVIWPATGKFNVDVEDVLLQPDLLGVTLTMQSYKEKVDYSHR